MDAIVTKDMEAGVGNSVRLPAALVIKLGGCSFVLFFLCTFL